MTRAERDLLLIVAGTLQVIAPEQRLLLQRAIEAVAGNGLTLVSDERLSEIIVLREGTDEAISMAQELSVHRARARTLHNPKDET